LFDALNGLIIWMMEFLVSAKIKFGGLTGKAAWRILELFLGGSATFLLFNYFWQWTDFNLVVYGEIMLEYSLVMLIPFVIVEIFGIIQKKRPSNQITMLHFVAENGKDRFRVRADELLYIKSESNYVELFYQVDDTVKSYVLRTSIKKILEHDEMRELLKQSHRSYVVNENKIKRVSREKGKMQIDLGNVKIPVSKTFESSFLD
jgi:hypothetical protein